MSRVDCKVVVEICPDLRRYSHVGSSSLELGVSVSSRVRFRSPVLCVWKKSTLVKLHRAVWYSKWGARRDRPDLSVVFKSCEGKNETQMLNSRWKAPSDWLQVIRDRARCVKQQRGGWSRRLSFSCTRLVLFLIYTERPSRLCLSPLACISQHSTIEAEEEKNNSCDSDSSSLRDC